MEDRISLESPADLENNNSVRLSMYLYRIVENPYMKNRFPVEGAGGKARKPPLTLDLYYLLTPMLGDSTRAADRIRQNNADPI